MHIKTFIQQCLNRTFAICINAKEIYIMNLGSMLQYIDIKQI